MVANVPMTLCVHTHAFGRAFNYAAFQTFTWCLNMASSKETSGGENNAWSETPVPDRLEDHLLLVWQFLFRFNRKVKSCFWIKAAVHWAVLMSAMCCSLCWGWPVTPCRSTGSSRVDLSPITALQKNQERDSAGLCRISIIYCLHTPSRLWRTHFCTIPRWGGASEHTGVFSWAFLQ